MLKKISQGICISILLFCFCQSWIFLTSYRHITTNIEQLEPAQAVMILGARVFPSGRLSDVLRDRAKVAVQVYQAGKANKIIVSGDHGQSEYNEVEAVKQFLLGQGIPEQDIFLDHAGFDTYDSLHRANSVFAIESLIISTQQTHLPRAVFVSKAQGITTQGITADLQSYRGLRQQIIREYLARAKAMFDVLTNAKPRFLGPIIPITGDGRTSWE